MYPLTTSDDISKVVFNPFSVLARRNFPDTVIADRKNTDATDLRENNDNAVRNPVNRLWHNRVVTKRPWDTRGVNL